MPLRPLRPRVATMVSRHEFVLGPWEPTRGPTAPARSVHCGGAPLSARRNETNRSSFNDLCEIRGVGVLGQFHPGGRTLLAHITGDMPMPKAGRPHSGKWIAYYKVSKDRHGIARWPPKDIFQTGPGQLPIHSSQAFRTAASKLRMDDILEGCVSYFMLRLRM
jgi:hypothetical protein